MINNPYNDREYYYLHNMIIPIINEHEGVNFDPILNLQAVPHLEHSMFHRHSHHFQ